MTEMVLDSRLTEVTEQIMRSTSTLLYRSISRTSSRITSLAHTIQLRTPTAITITMCATTLPERILNRCPRRSMSGLNLDTRS